MWIHSERQQKGVTLALLHEEYLAAHPGGYRYTRFCGHYRRWCNALQKKLSARTKRFARARAQTVFMAACGASVASTAYGATLFKTPAGVTIATGGTGAPVTVPGAVAGAILAVAGLTGMQRFYFGLVKGGVNAISVDHPNISALSTR